MYGKLCLKKRSEPERRVERTEVNGRPSESISADIRSLCKTFSLQIHGKTLENSLNKSFKKNSIKHDPRFKIVKTFFLSEKKIVIELSKLYQNWNEIKIALNLIKHKNEIYRKNYTWLMARNISVQCAYFPVLSAFFMHDT